MFYLFCLSSFPLSYFPASSPEKKCQGLRHPTVTPNPPISPQNPAGSPFFSLSPFCGGGGQGPPPCRHSETTSFYPTERATFPLFFPPFPFSAHVGFFPSPLLSTAKGCRTYGLPLSSLFSGPPPFSFSSPLFGGRHILSVFAQGGGHLVYFGAHSPSNKVPPPLFLFFPPPLPPFHDGPFFFFPPYPLLIRQLLLFSAQRRPIFPSSPHRKPVPFHSPVLAPPSAARLVPSSSFLLSLMRYYRWPSLGHQHFSAARRSNHSASIFFSLFFFVFSLISLFTAFLLLFFTLTIRERVLWERPPSSLLDSHLGPFPFFPLQPRSWHRPLPLF